MAVAFTRQLGAESGVQLNPLRDNSELPVQDNSDQSFGIMMRLTRGRFDRPFKVHRGNVFQKCGKGETMQTSALNEAWAQTAEALNNGAYEAVVQRLVTPAATIQYIVCTQGSGAVLTATVAAGAVTSVAVTNGGTGYPSNPKITIGGPGTGATLTLTVVAGVITAAAVATGGTGYATAPTITVSPDYGFSLSATIPVTPFIFAVKHLEAYNDGIKVEFRADEKKTAGTAVANDVINLIVRDIDDNVLYDATGSLLPNAKDDYSNSYFLPNVMSKLTDTVEITIHAAATSIATTSPAYGYAANGQANWARSGIQLSFTEGSTAYVTTDYIAARQKLQYTQFDYAYISAGGTQSPGMLAQLVQLAYDTNRQVRFDVPGNLTVDAAIAFVDQLNLTDPKSDFLVHRFWMPVKSDDSTGINGNTYIGAATLNIGYACGRNAQRNSRGFAPKNFPVAGREWPVTRTSMRQMIDLRDQDLNALARAQINPVCFESYTGGARCVFRDSLTSAKVTQSLRMLIAVADMATTIDDAVTRAGKDFLQLPMDVGVKRMSSFMESLFDGAQASGWLVPSDAPEMKGAAYLYDVRPNAARPYDRMDVSYWLRYVGTIRQIFVTQTLSR